MSKMSSRAWLCAGVSVAAFATTASADDLLIVDLTVANEVTITATAGLSAVTASGPDSIGVYFENFYGVAGGPLSATLVSGDITNVMEPPDNSPALFRGGGGTDPGLNLWSWSTASTVNFTAGAQAFTGSGTWSLDPAEYADMLAGGVTGGNLWFPADTVDDIPGAQQLGTYVVIIPAPGAFMLLGAGLGLGMVRRRR